MDVTIIILLTNKSPWSSGDWYIHWDIFIDSIFIDSMFIDSIYQYYSSTDHLLIDQSLRLLILIISKSWHLHIDLIYHLILYDRFGLTLNKSAASTWVTKVVTASSLYIRSRDHFFSNCSIIFIYIILTTIIIIRIGSHRLWLVLLPSSLSTYNITLAVIDIDIVIIIIITSYWLWLISILLLSSLLFL